MNAREETVHVLTMRRILATARARLCLRSALLISFTPARPESFCYFVRKQDTL